MGIINIVSAVDITVFEVLTLYRSDILLYDSVLEVLAQSTSLKQLGSAAVAVEHSQLRA